jgi:hypothetical protein
MSLPCPLNPTTRSARHWARRAAGPTLLWLALALISGLAVAATIKGQVTGHDRLINPVWAEAAKPGTHRYTWREPSPTVRAEFRQLFGLSPKELCIAALLNGDVKPPQVPILITIGGGRTTPVTIVVAPGTRLQFRNNDPFKHNLYAVGEKSFPASIMEIASARDWTAPGEGTYELRDELAPSLRSWVVVKRGVAAIGYPGRDGMFVLQGLNPGDYTLQPYFAGKPMGTPRAVSVDKGDVDTTKQPMPVADVDGGAKGK